MEKKQNHEFTAWAVEDGQGRKFYVRPIRGTEGRIMSQLQFVLQIEYGARDITRGINETVETSIPLAWHRVNEFPWGKNIGPAFDYIEAEDVVRQQEAHEQWRKDNQDYIRKLDYIQKNGWEAFRKLETGKN